MGEDELLKQESANGKRRINMEDCVKYHWHRVKTGGYSTVIVLIVRGLLGTQGAL